MQLRAHLVVAAALVATAFAPHAAAQDEPVAPVAPAPQAGDDDRDALTAQIAELRAVIAKLEAASESHGVAIVKLADTVTALEARLRTLETNPGPASVSPAPGTPAPPAPPPGPVPPPAPAPAEPFEWTKLEPSADTRTLVHTPG